MECETATLQGFSFYSDNEESIMNSLRLANAVLFLELLEYGKSQSLSMLSFLKLFAVKKERNSSRHCDFLPSVLVPRDQNLLRISQMLTRNSIDESTVQTHALFSANHYAQLIEFLNKLA